MGHERRRLSQKAQVDRAALVVLAGRYELSSVDYWVMMDSTEIRLLLPVNVPQLSGPALSNNLGDGPAVIDGESLPAGRIEPA
jgi:hypothetical protein